MLTVIATHHMMAGLGIEILAINHGIEDEIVYRWSDCSKTYSSVVTDGVFMVGENDDIPIDLDECLRV